MIYIQREVDGALHVVVHFVRNGLSPQHHEFIELHHCPVREAAEYRVNTESCMADATTAETFQVSHHEIERLGKKMTGQKNELRACRSNLYQPLALKSFCPPIFLPPTSTSQRLNPRGTIAVAALFQSWVLVMFFAIPNDGMRAVFGIVLVSTETIALVLAPAPAKRLAGSLLVGLDCPGISVVDFFSEMFILSTFI